MGKYSWDIEEIIRLRNNIKDNLSTYQTSLDVYNTLIESYDIRSNNIGIIEQDYYLDTSLLEGKRSFNSISKEARDIVIGAINTTKKYDLRMEKPFFSTLTMNDDELVNLTKRLFEVLPVKAFSEKFSKIASPYNHHLHIIHKEKTPIDCFGFSYIDKLNKTSYGIIARYNTIQDIITLAHEGFHLIVRQKEQQKNNNYLYQEIEGCFANLIVSFIMQNDDFYKNEFLSFDKIELQSKIDTIIDLFIVNNGLTLMDRNNNINFKTLEEILKTHNITTTITNENFHYFLEDDLKENVSYSLSYLAALDLFNLYKIDPEKALYNLLKIVTLTGEKPKKELESIGVTFFEDGYKNLDTHCKRLLKEKTTFKK